MTAARSRRGGAVVARRAAGVVGPGAQARGDLHDVAHRVRAFGCVHGRLVGIASKKCLAVSADHVFNGAYKLCVRELTCG